MEGIITRENVGEFRNYINEKMKRLYGVHEWCSLVDIDLQDCIGHDMKETYDKITYIDRDDGDPYPYFSTEINSQKIL